MNYKLLAFLTAAFLGLGASSIAVAKPEMDKGKNKAESHRAEMKKMNHDRGDDLYSDHKKKRDESPSGLEKQREKKAEQERKELDKGSEQGRESRQEHSRKWWRFWE